MRILVIHESNLPYGGGERYLHDTCDALRELGHRVAVACAAEWNGDYLPADRTYGMSRSFGLRTGFRVRGEFDSMLEAERPDVVYLNGLIRSFVSPVILQHLIRRYPTVVFLHHVGSICLNGRKFIVAGQRSCEHPLGYRCVWEGCVLRLDGGAYAKTRSLAIGLWRRRVLRECRRVIAPSQYVQRELVRNGFPSWGIRVLPYFTTKGERGAEEPMGNQILWVGRADEGKGLDLFFQALARLPNVDWQAVVVGDDTTRPQVRAMAQAAGIAERARFVGRLDGEELDCQYQASRVVAFTSRWAETFGQVGIEAMAFGRPVVAFDVGGVTEWLSDGVTGFVVRRDDVRSMADRLSRLLADDLLCQRMGAAGRDVVEGRFRPAHHIPRLLAVFEEAIACCGAGAGR